MLMNENSELRSFVSCSKNFSKNIINKSIKNNIVPINNDGGVKASGLTRGFIPSTFGVTLSHIKFTLPIKTYSLFYTLFYFFNIISSYILSFIVTRISFISLFLVVACNLMYIVYFVVFCIVIRILIKISNNSLINISFCSSFIFFIYISFIIFIIFTSFTGLFISDNTIITI